MGENGVVLNEEERQNVLKCGLFPMQSTSTIAHTPKVWESVPAEFRPTYHFRAYTCEERDRLRQSELATMQSVFDEVSRLSEDELVGMSWDMPDIDGESDEERKQRMVLFVQSKLWLPKSQMDAEHARSLTCPTIMGWENKLDSNGEKIAYQAASSGGLDKDLWQYIHDRELRDMQTFLASISGLTVTEVRGLS